MVLKKKGKLPSGEEIEYVRAEYATQVEPWSVYILELPDGRAARLRIKNVVTDVWVAEKKGPDGLPIFHTEAQAIAKVELLDPDERPPKVTT